MDGGGNHPDEGVVTWMEEQSPRWRGSHLDGGVVTQKGGVVTRMEG